MLEKTHIAGVVREIKKLGELHSQSMTFGSLSTNGTPDRYFDGAQRDLWAEFKRLTAIPRNGIAVGDYSDLQIKWLTRRWNAGWNAWGIVGLPNKLVCMQYTPLEWQNGTSIKLAITHKEAAKLIWEHCNGVTDVRTDEAKRVGSDSSGHSRIRKTRR